MEPEQISTRLAKCYICKQMKSEDQFFLDKSRSNGCTSACKECRTIIKGHIRAQRIAVFTRPVEGTKFCRLCQRDLPVAAFRTDRGSTTGLHHCCAECALAKHVARRMEALTRYGGSPPQCACCGETRYEFLAIDHIEGGGTQMRRQNKSANAIAIFLKDKGWPSGFRVLCHNCNLARGFYGECPHEAEQRKECA